MVTLHAAAVKVTIRGSVTGSSYTAVSVCFLETDDSSLDGLTFLQLLLRKGHVESDEPEIEHTVVHFGSGGQVTTTSGGILLFVWCCLGGRVVVALLLIGAMWNVLCVTAFLWTAVGDVLAEATSFP